MADAYHIRSVLLEFIAALAVLLVCFGNVSHAASGQVAFGGVVTQPTQNGGMKTYARELVSFGSQAMLPVGQMASDTDDVRVFDAKGERVFNSPTSYVSSGGNRLPGQIVNLSDRGVQVFIVCAGSKRNCMRYRVTRH